MRKNLMIGISTAAIAATFWWIGTHRTILTPPDVVKESPKQVEESPKQVEPSDDALSEPDHISPLDRCYPDCPDESLFEYVGKQPNDAFFQQPKVKSAIIRLCARPGSDGESEWDSNFANYKWMHLHFTIALATPEIVAIEWSEKISSDWDDSNILSINASTGHAIFARDEAKRVIVTGDRDTMNQLMKNWLTKHNFTELIENENEVLLIHPR